MQQGPRLRPFAAAGPGFLSRPPCRRATEPLSGVKAGAALLVYGCIPVALSNSEGAGSVLVLAWLPGAHLYIQVLGNEKT